MNTSEEMHVQFTKDVKAGNRQSPLRAIRIHCLECMGYNYAEVTNCKGNEMVHPCPLYTYRTGRNKSGLKVKSGKPFIFKAKAA